MKRLIVVPLVLMMSFAAPASADPVDDLKGRLQTYCADPESCLCIDEYVADVHIYQCGWRAAG